MENTEIDFDVNAAFVYDKEHDEKAEYICKRIPPPCPQRGDEQYYVWRFNNFMERHVDCAHEPPVYYYGLLEKAEEIDREVKEEEGRKIQLNPKQYYLGLDKALLEKQKGVKKYEKNGYWMKPNISKSYGYKYCLAFGKLLSPKLSDKGQLWVKKTLDYLQRYMEAGLVDLDWESTENINFNSKYKLNNKSGKIVFYTDIELNNARFRTFAFATHPDAYIKAGITNLPLKDLILISSTPDLAEWWDGDTRIQAIIVAKKLVEEKMEQVKEQVKKIF